MPTPRPVAHDHALGFTLVELLIVIAIIAALAASAVPSFIDYVRRGRITEAVTRLSEIGMSHLADNVVVLQYLRAESEVKRALLVLKTRASEHHPEIREFKIQPGGIVLGDKFAANQGFE